ncbi:hypothetical protein [Poseidonocella pacifica]|uniref:hypothetical protein n=1 Tax=Poseidonocella pacifica TaxID=871651 RepID=UPI001113E498|nr:hypothetical protein [Poseidonocella pacifica]
MTPHHTNKGTRGYRSYASMDVIKKRLKAEIRGPQRLPGGVVEDAVVGEIRRLLRTPKVRAVSLVRNGDNGGGGVRRTCTLTC